MVRHYLTHEDFEEIINMNADEFIRIPIEKKYKDHFDDFIYANTEIRKIQSIIRTSGEQQTINDGTSFFVEFVAVNWDGKTQVYEIVPIEEWLNGLQKGYAMEGEWDYNVTFDDFLAIINLSI